MTLQDLKKDLKKVSTKKRAATNAWFFKTEKDQYGHGDVFIGVSMPDLRKVISIYTPLSLTDVMKLLGSKIHEERMAAVLILVKKYEQGDESTKKKIYELYLGNAKQVNNWDLVDSSAHKIVGPHLYMRPRRILYRLATSKNLWERRIAIIATAYFISKNQFEDTLQLSEKLLGDDHDLMHKAVGWMLREVGKRDQRVLEVFLKTHIARMPRTMLRYAIEKFPEKKRKAYLSMPSATKKS